MKISITIPAQNLATYITSLDMAIGACDSLVTHWNSADHLRELREHMMKMYIGGEENALDSVS